MLELAAAKAAEFLEGLGERPVAARASVEELRSRLGGPLPEDACEPRAVLEGLVAGADAGLVAAPGGRYYGFVTGGAVPAALAADWLASAWDQNAFSYVGSPAASVAEEVAGGWVRELLGLPVHASFALTTGCQMAHVTALATARLHVLQRAGWDVARDGLFGAPRVRVVAGDNRHVTLDRALRLLGFGNASVVALPLDGSERLRVDALASVLAEPAPTIVCVQAGDVNTGAFDPVAEIAPLARAAGAWLHVDGAFGLWAAASPELRPLVAGVELADSWATDGHKWLNVPYDCGFAFTAHPESHRAAMGGSAAYLPPSNARDAFDWTPEASRRARGFAVYAAVKSLGRSGVAQMVERCCAHARRFAELLGADPHVAILNEVVLNQVLVRFHDDDEATRRVIELVQASGEAWMGGTTWSGRAAMRISVSNWQTTDADVERASSAILAAASAV